jgi:replicative DNA helicase
MSKYPQKNKPISFQDYGRVPPQATDIEELILGTLINDYHIIAKYPYLKPEVFYKESHRIIYKGILDLYDKDMKPDLLILCDHLRSNHQLENTGGIVYITKLSNNYSSDIDTHVKLIMDKYFYRKIIELSYYAQTNSFDGMKDPIDIIDELQNSLMEITEFDGDVQNNFTNTLKSTINNIKIASKGDNITVLKTGWNNIDTRFTFRTRYICIIAGPEGVGKSKFTIGIVRAMLDNEPDLAVQWFSFEEDREQLVRSFFAMDLRKTTKELQSINYTMTDKDLDEIDACSAKYKNYIIEYYDKATSINNIMSRSKRFSDKYKEKKRVIIIDNLGLIDCDKVGLDRDDFVAAKIKSIADNTNSCIILIHHFTKEISRKANLEDGYRPRKEYLKGSTRILDYVQQALFVNLLRKYPDLLAEEKHLSLDFISRQDIEFTETNFDQHLWSLNTLPDKETKNIIDLRTETLMKTKSLLNNDSKFTNGKIITFSDLIQKYSEYSIHIDTKNKGREEKYKSEKCSIYMFIIKKKFNENYINNASSPRSLYLYGKNKNLKYHIDDLFIVESVKNRDDDNLNENAIYRFIADLGYNLFTEIDDDGKFELSKQNKPKALNK